MKKKEFESQVLRTESLIRDLDALPDEGGRRIATEAIEALLGLHGEGLERILEILDEAGEPGRALIERLGRDEMVGGLLLLHGLHPLSLEARVQQALDKVKPYLASHGGSVQLLGVSEEGGIRLRLEGSCHGCASSAMTLKYAIEQAIREAAPDAFAIEVEGVVEQPAQPDGFVPLTQIKGMREQQSPSPAWQPVSGLDALAPGRAGARELGGSRIAFCRVDGAWYAYADLCPRCRGSLDGAGLQGPVLACPGCGLRYDVQRAGRCLDASEHHLEPLPLLEEGGQVRVAAAAAVS